MPPEFVRPGILGMELPPFDPLNRRAAELRAEGHHVISLGQAVPHFGPPASALDAARAALDSPAVNRYVTDPGLPSLRAVLAERLAGTLGAPIGGEDLIITAGGNHAFALACATLIEPGSEVVLPAPYFTNHQMMLVAAGAVPVEAPVADRTTFSVTWDDIQPHLTTRTRAIVLCNPSNPTGAPIEPAHGMRIVQEAADRGLLIISDETYLHFVYEGAHWSAVSAPAWRRHIIVIGTFSKSFGMMGWRVGFMLADASICAQAVKVQDAMIICAPAISQIAAEAAVRDNWSYPLSFHDEMRERRRVLADGVARIPGVTWTPARGGLFAFVRIERRDDSAQMSRNLLERTHVVTLAGSAFGRCGEGHLRLSYGVAGQQDLAEAARRLSGFL